MPGTKRWGAALALVPMLLLASCARLGATFRSFDYGGAVSSHALRQSLAARQYDSALKWTSAAEHGAPGDALLRDLYAGTVAYYAGRYAESAAALQRAGDAAEDRYTRSVSRGALSLVANDGVLAYEPGPTERLMVHYYGALAYLRAGSVPEAAVEARRLVHLIERYEEAGTPVHRGTRAALHYLAGAVFEAAGERNDAAVAYRDAVAASGDSSLAPLPPTSGPRGRAPRRAEQVTARGELVVVVEHGFIAEKVEQSVAASFESDEVVVFSAADAERQSASAAALASQLLDQLGAGRADSGVIRVGGREGGERYVLTLAWPAFRRTPVSSGTPRLLVDADSAGASPRVAADLSDAVSEDFARIAPRVVARAVARGATKYYLTRQAKKKGGHVAGALANAGTAMLERADTRSWHLLPGALSVIRMTLPPGRHRLALVAGRERVELDDVEIAAGQLAFAAGRLWR